MPRFWRSLWNGSRKPWILRSPARRGGKGSRRDHRTLRLESLEGRQLLAAVFPTSYEQYQVELINRARANPTAYAASLGISLNEGLAAGTITSTPKAPVAVNPNLTDAAQKHSQWMLDVDAFSHTGAGGTTILQRMKNAGYVFSGSYGYAENIGWQGTTATPNLTQYTKSIQESLFVDKGVASRGHRKNMLFDWVSEVGVGVRSGVFRSGSTNYNSVMVTQDFAKSGTSVFLTGVAFADSVTADRFYTPGEGLGSVTIVATRESDGVKFSTTTWAAGGYSLALPAGRYNILASGGALGASQFIPGVTIGTSNVKLDFMKGTVRTGAEADVRAGTVFIANGDTTPSTADLTDFGSTAVNGGTVNRVFTIQNNGNATLTLTSSTRVYVSGANAADFIITALPVASIAAGGTSNFTVQFNPSAAGLRKATITFNSNDSNENPFTFAVSGIGTAPRIGIKGNGIAIADGDRAPATTDGSDFGKPAIANGTVTKTFTITNTGSAPLTLTGTNPVTITGKNAADFTVTVKPAATLAVGASTTFTISFKPTATGRRSAIVNIASNDLISPLYDFAIIGG